MDTERIIKSLETQAAGEELTRLRAENDKLNAAVKEIRLRCNGARRDYRRYRRIDPESFQVWACSEYKGAMLLARRLVRLLPNS